MMRPAREQGVALILVLWACALMAIVLGGFAALARTEGLQAHYQAAQTRARYAAQAGLARAVAALHDPDLSQRWRGDGRPYTFTFSGATVTVKITDEDGKVDLNAATPKVLAGLLQAAGLTRSEAQDLAAAIADWRDSDHLARPGGAEAERYREAGRDYGPRNGPFASIEELQLVLGMNAALYAKLAPLVTIWSGRHLPNAAHAPAAVLAALPGMDMQAAHRYADRRQHADPADGLPRLPNGMQVAARGGGNAHSIVSTATLADGVKAVLHATIRRRGNRPDQAPYAVLQWQEGIASE
jgi:general secretion pathway protein K